MQNFGTWLNSLLILITLPIVLISCKKEDTVRLYQREGRTLVILESEFELQSKLLNLSFQSRDSLTRVEPIFLDTIQRNVDTITIMYDYLAKLSDGEELPLRAPREEIFSYIGRQLPDFALPDLDGNLVAFDKFLDKPVVLNFWFRACTPCKKEMPRLNEIREVYKDRVNFVAICLDDIDELKGFFKYFDFDYEHLINGRELAQRLGIKSYPKNIVINKNGSVSQILDYLLQTIDEDGNRLPGKGQELIREIEQVL